MGQQEPESHPYVSLYASPKSSKVHKDNADVTLFDTRPLAFVSPLAHPCVACMSQRVRDACARVLLEHACIGGAYGAPYACDSGGTNVHGTPMRQRDGQHGAHTEQSEGEDDRHEYRAHHRGSGCAHRERPPHARGAEGAGCGAGGHACLRTPPWWESPTHRNPSQRIEPAQMQTMVHDVSGTVSKSPAIMTMHTTLYDLSAALSAEVGPDEERPS
jgi:hypothetical protein